MVCSFEIPLGNFATKSKVVGSVQTISYSIHNEKMPVRVLGNMNVRNWVFGNRTIAGSIIFTVFDNHWIRDFMDEYLRSKNIKARGLADEMPPINITISFANEYGQRARLALYGVVFVNEGQVMSINDIYTENTFQYYAQDIDYMAPSNDPSQSKDTKNNMNDDVKGTKVLPFSEKQSNGEGELANDVIDNPDKEDENSKSDYDPKELNTVEVDKRIELDPASHPKLNYENEPKEKYEANLEKEYKHLLELIRGLEVTDAITPEKAKFYRDKAEKFKKTRLKDASVYYTKKEKEDKKKAKHEKENNKNKAEAGKQKDKKSEPTPPKKDKNTEKKEP